MTFDDTPAIMYDALRTSTARCVVRLSSSLFVCSSILFFCASAQAGQPVEKPVAADTADKFAQVIDEVQQEMGAGGRYEFAKAEDKAKIEADLKAMAAMLQKSGSVAAMSQPEKVQLFNTQENLNGVLTHNDSNRLVCEHKAPVGTSIPRTTCQTVGEIERSRKESRKTLLEAGAVGSTCSGQAVCAGH